MDTETPELSNAQQEWLDSLREMADFLEAHPDLIEPYLSIICYRFCKGTREEFAKTALQLGASTKSSDATWFQVARKFGIHTIQVTQPREDICEKKVVGTEEIETEEPDPEAVAALPKVKTVKTVEKVEWVCPPSLHALAAS